MPLLTTLSSADALEAFYALLDALPPIGQLIECIPHSLPLLERVFRFYQRLSDNARESAWRQLECVQLLNKILWWLAFLQERRCYASAPSKTSPPLIHKMEAPFDDTILANCIVTVNTAFPLAVNSILSHSSSSLKVHEWDRSTISKTVHRNRSLSTMSTRQKTVAPPAPSQPPPPLPPLQLPSSAETASISNTALIRSILRIIHKERPEILDDILSERRQLAQCLECLGCHGLVNAYPTGRLVCLVDAAISECTAHMSRIKKIIHRMRVFQRSLINFDIKQPSLGGHQHQINLKLSQVFERLRQNEIIEKLMFEILHNNQLSGLLRITRKRIQTDKILVGMFNSYLTTIPRGFAVMEKNPVVAKLIFVFKNAYDQFAALIDASIVASPSAIGRKMDEEPLDADKDTYATSTNPPLSLRSKEFSFPEATLPEGDSVTVFGGESLDYRVASLTMRQIFGAMLDTDRTTIADEKFALSRASSFASRNRVNARVNHSGGDEEKEDHYFEADCCSRDDESRSFLLLRVDEEVVVRFVNLFAISRGDVLNALNLLPEMRNCRFLQHKAMLTTIVNCFDMASDAYSAQFASALKTLEPGLAAMASAQTLSTRERSASDLLMLRHYAYRVMEISHASTGQPKSRAVILARVQSALGVNSLTSCQRFICFVSDCLSVCWELARHSTIQLEFNATEFDDTKYARIADANAAHNKIRQCIWPGIVARIGEEERVILKAQALT